MRSLFLVSFDQASDELLGHIVALLKGRYPLYTRYSDSTEYSVTANGTSTENDRLSEEELEEEKELLRSLTGAPLKNRSTTPAHLLKADELETIEELLEPIGNGDMVLFMMDVGSRDMLYQTGYMSCRIMEIGAFSFCLTQMRGGFRDIKQIERLNKEFLDLSMRFHGVIALPPRVIRAGRYLDLAHIIRNLADMSFRPGMVNLDHADIMITSKGGTVLILTWGSAKPGGQPAATSVNDALENPLCDIELTTVRKALVNVVGDRGLTLEDSLVAAEVLRKRIKPNSRLIWGVSLLEEMGEDMEVFLVLATTPMELLLHWYSS